MKDVEVFKEKLFDVIEILIIIEMIVEILGISSIIKYNFCCLCFKKVIIKGKIVVCDNCKII